MSWIPLQSIINKIQEQKFFWHRAPETKYLTIRVDTRDDYAVLMDGDGKLIAETIDQLNEFFDKLNSEADETDAGLWKVQKQLNRRSE